MATKRAIHEKQLPQEERDRRRERRTANARRRTGKEPPPKKRSKSGSTKVGVNPTAAAVVYDNMSLDDWDDEELMHGRRKNRNGNFGRRPLVVPARMVQELTRRRFSRAHMLMSESLEDSVLMLRSIVNDDDAPPFARIKAAETIFDRILGKPRESIEVGISAELEPSAFQKAFTAAIVGTMSQAQEAAEAERTIIDAEIVDEADA